MAFKQTVIVFTLTFLMTGTHSYTCTCMQIFLNKIFVVFLAPAPAVVVGAEVEAAQDQDCNVSPLTTAQLGICVVRVDSFDGFQATNADG